MKKAFIRFIGFFIVCVLAASLSTAVYAEEKFDRWFVVRNKENKQPILPKEFEYIKKHDAFFTDENHSDYCEEKVVYLTFDVGYENGNTAKILDSLKKENVKASFFVLKHLVSEETELVKRMSDEGHLLCNHSANHKSMPTLVKEEFFAEMTALEDIVREKCGVEVAKFYRPPRGEFSEQSLTWAEEMGYKTVFWSFAYADWDNKKLPSHQSILKKAEENMHNGGILLLHSASNANVEIIEDLIKMYKEKGYEFRTLDKI